MASLLAQTGFWPLLAPAYISMEIKQCGLTAAAFCQRAKKVNIEDSPHRVKVCTAWKTIIAVHDACVIHQNIELSIEKLSTPLPPKLFLPSRGRAVAAACTAASASTNFVSGKAAEPILNNLNISVLLVMLHLTVSRAHRAVPSAPIERRIVRGR